MVAPRLTENGVAAVVRPALALLALFTALTGVIYPLLVHAVAQTLFPRQANGSLLTAEKGVVGSELIGQPFTGPEWFWGRPSATTPSYNAAASSGSNLGPLHPALRAAVDARIHALGAPEPPIDLVTSSASGLDPHISPAAAFVQVDRVARARGLDAAEVRRLVTAHLEGRTLGLLGEPRVNVLRLNLALEGVK